MSGTEPADPTDASTAPVDAPSTPGEVDAAPVTPGVDAATPPVDPPPVGTPRDSARIFFLGHSLVGWDMPSMVHSFTRAAGVGMEWQAAIGIGATLAWQWEHPENAEGSNPRTTLPVTPFDVFVMTEAVPLAGNMEWSDTIGYAGRFYDLALAANPDVQLYIYEVWDHRTVADWRGLVDEDRARWESIADGLAGRPGPDPLIIPGGTAMAALHDAVRAGSIPGISSFDAFFVDSIHLSPQGWYFISLVQYATIYRRSPVGLPARTVDRWDAPYAAPPAEAIPALQQLAWDVVLRDPRTGVAAR